MSEEKSPFLPGLEPEVIEKPKSEQDILFEEIDGCSECNQIGPTECSEHKEAFLAHQIKNKTIVNIVNDNTKEEEYDVRDHCPQCEIVGGIGCPRHRK